MWAGQDKIQWKRRGISLQPGEATDRWSSNPYSTFGLANSPWKITLIEVEVGLLWFRRRCQIGELLHLPASHACRHNVAVSCPLIGAFLGSNRSPPAFCSPRRNWLYMQRATNAREGLLKGEYPGKREKEEIWLPKRSIFTKPTN